MCISLKRYYQGCSHEVQQLVRCALPYYWYDFRTVQGDQAQTPFFGCLDCLDEVEEDYRISCPECTGQGHVHARTDFVARRLVVDGKTKDPAAYEMMKTSYHRYLVVYMIWFVRHRLLSYEMFNEVVSAAARSQLPVLTVFNETVQGMRYNSFAGEGSGLTLVLSYDKIIAELKCRQDKDHDIPDSLGFWDKNETHLSEHHPFLNNVATAMRRGIAHTMMREFRDLLEMKFSALECPDVDANGHSDHFEDQEFAHEVMEYLDSVNTVEADDIAGPRKAGTMTPWDILEYVPLHPSENREARSRQLRAHMVAGIHAAEVNARRGSAAMRGDSTVEQYWRNEAFVDEALGFMFNTLAFDPGLSRSRMLELGAMCHSLLLEPWYYQFGREGRAANQNPQLGSHEAINKTLRAALLSVSEEAHRERLWEGHSDFRGSWWGNVCYRDILVGGDMDAQPTAQELQVAVEGRWQAFYTMWLQVLANVETSHTKLSQQQLDAAKAGGGTADGCIICGDDWDVGSAYNCPVYIPCGNNHILCLKCFTQITLTPTRPYNVMDATKNCPHCRGVLTYTTGVSNISAGLDNMPRLDVDFPFS